VQRISPENGRFTLHERRGAMYQRPDRLAALLPIPRPNNLVSVS